MYQHQKYKFHNIYSVFLLSVIISICFNSSFAQSNNGEIKQDTRSKNRRIADSLYYVHTLKKQKENIKQDTVKVFAVPKDLSSDIKPQIIQNKEIPCSTLYQNTWMSERVKSNTVSLKDIPDQVVLHLCGKTGNEKFCFPYKGLKTSGYGWRWGRPHTGLDIALKTGDKIYAAFDGVVRVAKFNGGYGNMVLIRHYNNLETLYGHMSEIKVKPGQKVKAGEVIGLGGSTGRSTGPHLHFECRLLYACLDPEWIVDIKNYNLKSKLIKIDKSYFGIPATQAIAEQQSKYSELSKVNKLMDGTKYIPKKELNKMIAVKNGKSTLPVQINNDDKSTWRYYSVKDGDNIEMICDKFNILPEDLIHINNIKDNKLKTGERIRIR